MGISGRFPTCAESSGEGFQGNGPKDDNAWRAKGATREVQTDAEDQGPPGQENDGQDSQKQTGRKSESGGT